MPLYEYVCANGHRTEVMHGLYATGPETCPQCGAAMRKAFVAPTIVFKGSGWAKMDRRSAGGGSKSSSSSSSSGSSGDSGSGSGDSKPASGESSSAGSSSDGASSSTATTSGAGASD